MGHFSIFLNELDYKFKDGQKKINRPRKMRNIDRVRIAAVVDLLALGDMSIRINPAKARRVHQPAWLICSAL